MRKSFVLIFILMSFNVNADHHAEMQACTKIVDNLARLTCFDQLAAKLDQVKTAQKPAAELEAPMMQTAPLVQKTEAKVQQELADVPSAPKPAVISKEQQVASFGKKAEQIDEVESIHAHMVGEFRGWVKGKIITLDNGQKWKVVGASKGYIRLMNPAVKIEKAIFGSFNMRVEGFTPFAKVKRIK